MHTPMLCAIVFLNCGLNFESAMSLFGMLMLTSSSEPNRELSGDPDCCLSSLINNSMMRSTEMLEAKNPYLPSRIQASTSERLTPSGR
jgi:hypothetical protein